MKDINYSEVNGYLFPNLKGREEVKVNSYFAQMKLKYLKTNEQGHLFSLMAKNELSTYLEQVEKEANEMYERLVEEFKVKWNVQNNGIILSDNITDDEAIPAPRPVYLQELQMLEVNKKYRMPKTDLPICWNIDARYYYKGQPFFERRGAGIYSKPDVIYNSDFTFSTLEPVDVDKMLEINREAIETMENEAMDFIMGCYETFKGKVDDYVVAFSGGKDSQVILDLVTRVLPVESFKAVFQDTDMELPCTYDIVAYTEEDYKYRFPNFKLYHAKSDRHALDLWKQYGPPSRVNRWCCSVMKTTVFRRTMKELHNTDKQPKVAVYEGVRSDESARAFSSGYRVSQQSRPPGGTSE